MNLPQAPSISLNLGILSFLKKRIFPIFLIIWFIAVVGIASFIYLQIKSKISEPLPPYQSAEFKVDKLNTEVFSSKLFLNLRTLAVSPGQTDYNKCLGVPGRPHIFTPFVPCP